MSRSLDFFVPCRPAPRTPAHDGNRRRLWRGEDGSPMGAPPTGRRPSPCPRHHRSLAGRVLRALLVCAVLGAAAGFAFFPNVRQAAAAVMPSATPREVFGADRVRILLVGADQDYDPQGRRVGSRGRADTLILVQLDFDEGTAHLCSIPRDTEADIPGHGMRRINSAYARGGTELTRAAVEQLTDLPVDYTVVVDIQAFVEVVDAIGGVDMEVENALDYDDHWGGLHIHIPAGRQRLDGERAMQYVRFRHDALADIGRARRQQQFLVSLRRQMREPAGILAWPGVARAVARHIETDLTPAQIIALGRFARELDEISTETLPGSFHRSRWRPDPVGVRQLAARLSRPALAHHRAP